MDNSSLIRLLALLIAIAPAMIIFAYFMVMARMSFRAEKLWNAFGCGAVIAFPCVIIAQVFNWLIDLGGGPLALSLKKSLFMAAIPEELLKLGTVLIICWEDLADLHPRKLFMMAIACGCGFACFENIIYVFEQGHWQTTALRRSISAVPGHAFVSALMGYCIYKAVHGRRWWWGLAVIAPIMCHSAYDFFLFAADHLSQIAAPDQDIYWMTWGFICCVVLEGAMAHLVVKKLINNEQTLTLAAEEGEVWQSRLDSIVNSPYFWGSVGGLSLLVAAYFAFDMRDKLGTVDVVLDQGFAVFSLLHALAFLLLMLSQLRRSKQGLIFPNR